MKRRLLSYLLLISLLSTASAKEFQVNTRTSRNQANAAIATDEQGNFAVVWASWFASKSNEIKGRRFAADGSPIDANEFEINTIKTGNQKEPDVAMDAVGNFVVTWQGPGQDQNDIFAQRFDANGQKIDSEFRVNSNIVDEQLCPSVAVNNDGNCVIVWESEDIPEEGKRAICGQLYDSSGSSVGTEFVVNDEPSTCRFPDVTMHSSGRFVVVWVRESTLKSVRVRHFDANGTAPYLSSKVNDDFNFTSLTRPSVAIDANGNYVIAWDGHPNSYLQDDIYLKRYHWSHAPLHKQFLVNTDQPGAQSNPFVAMSDDGRFVVVWQSDTGTDGTKTDIFGQRFPRQEENIGDPILMGEQFQINTYVVDDQKYPDVALKETGEFVTVWQSDGQDGSDYGIFADIGPAVPCADFTGNGFVNFYDYCIFAEEWLKEQNPLKTDLVDDNKINQLDLNAFCGQWLMPCYDCNDVDIYTDGKIDFKDYCLWAQGYLQQGPLKGDVTGNGTVDLADLKALIFHWAKSCE